MLFFVSLSGTHLTDRLDQSKLPHPASWRPDSFHMLSLCLCTPGRVAVGEEEAWKRLNYTEHNAKSIHIASAATTSTYNVSFNSFVFAELKQVHLLHGQVY